MDVTQVVELRIHGVGGPQGPKILGYTSETDVVTEPAFTTASGAQVPADANSRFLRPVVPDTTGPVEAYEWGKLTTGSLLKSLWIVFLPFTLLNVGGWARASCGQPGRTRAWRDLGARVLGYLGTVCYVLWSGYLLLELVAFQWRARLNPGAARTAVVIGAVVVFMAFLFALGYANRLSGRQFEGTNPDREPGSLPDHWDDSETALHPDFFAHQRSRDRLRNRHIAVAAATAFATLALAWGAVGDGRSRIGLVIMLVATVQVGVLVLMWVTAFARGGLRLPRAALLTLGTVLCHAFFAGVAMWLRDRLKTVPATDDPSPLAAGAELALSDQFAIALALAVVAALVATVVPNARDRTASGLIPRAARKATILGPVVALAFVVTFGQFTVRQVIDPGWSCPVVDGQPAKTSAWDRAECWYDAYPVGETNALQDLGGKVLLFMPVLIGLSLRSKSLVGSIVGNVWDVFTFWPRRYHPFAVPPYAERAVPELRARLRAQVDGGGGVVVSAHSQGSVLSVAALCTEIQPPQPTRIHLVVYGSPLGTLIAPVFSAALGMTALGTLRADLERAGGRWWVFWRKTDPIGGPLFGPGHPDECELVDPPDGATWTPPADLATRPPLDRPPRWGVTRGHGFYPAESAYRHAVAQARASLSSPS